KEIKDILAYLRLIANPNDDISFSRIVNVPKRGIGATTIDKVVNYTLQHDITISATLNEVDFIGVSKRATNSLAEFHAMIQSLAKKQEYISVTELVAEVLKQTKYIEMLQEENK